MGTVLVRALSAAALLVAPAAYAQTGSALFVSPMGQAFRGADPLADWFAAADADHDGALTRAEFEGDAAQEFARADRNHNQALTSLESTALLRAEAPEVLSRDVMGPPIDTRNHEPNRQYDSRSGNVDITEVTEAPARRTPQPTLSGAARFGIVNVVEPVMSCDTDFSMSVTAAEFTTCADHRFAELDANGDGGVTLAEARTAHAELRAR